MSKFVSAKLPVQYAEELHNTQLKIARLEKQLKELKIQERQLGSHLMKMVHGRSFQFNSGSHLKQLVIRNHSRMILDQDKCKLLLKSRTPYSPSEWTTIKVDFVYE